MSSALDSNIWKRGIAKALQVTGIQEAPNQIATDEVKVTVDALQDGFSDYEIVTAEKEIVLAGGASPTFIFFDPTEPEGDPFNNSQYEIRLLGFRLRVKDIAAVVAGDNISVQLNWFDPANPTLNTCIFLLWERLQVAGINDYNFNFPSMTIEENGAYQLFNSFQWSGWIPHKAAIHGVVKKDTVFAGTEDFIMTATFARVPRNSKPPW